LSLPPALALPGSLVVTITAPASGSTVSGTRTVSASVSIIGFVVVDRVQFRLDGADLGAADTSAPYSISWNTTSASNGPHTLTAVARDVFGVPYTSNPVSVTVFNDTTAPAVAVTSPAAGASLSGSVAINASATDNVGVAAVQFFVDGAMVGAGDDTSAPYSVSWDTTAVANGSHRLTARARDAVGNIATSAAVTVTVANGPPPDTTPPTVSISSPAGGASVSGTIPVSAGAADNVGVVGVQFRLDGADLGAEDTTAPYSIAWDTTTATNASHSLTARARDAAGNVTTSLPVTVSVSNSPAPPPSVTRVEDADASVSYTGAWFFGNTTRAFSGGSASFSRGPAAQASFTFTGTRVSWIGWRAPQAGIARVLLDGALVATIDLFAAAEEVQATVFTSADLASGSHTLVIEATGTANAAASDTIVVVDAFDVTSSATPPPPPPPPPGTVTRFEEASSAIAYSPGAWIEETTMPWSGGRALYAVGAGPQATFTFTGTAVDWIGYRGRYGGIVQVFLDGVLAAELDTYSATEEVSVIVYSASGLAPGDHSLRIELTGLRNPAAVNSETAVDAFDVTP
jgi:hypothetical protein